MMSHNVTSVLCRYFCNEQRLCSVCGRGSS